MEYRLKYSNNEINRRREFPFKFKSHDYIKDYSFSYNRDGLQISIALFKDLVAISKDATRSFDFKVRELTIGKVAKDTNYSEKVINFKTSKPLDILTVGLFTKRVYKTSEYVNNILFMHKDKIRKIWLEHGHFLERPINYGFDKKYVFLKEEDNDLSRFDQILLKDHHKKEGFDQFDNYNIKRTDNNIAYYGTYLAKRPMLKGLEDKNHWLARTIDSIFLSNGLFQLQRSNIYNANEGENIFLSDGSFKNLNIFEVERDIDSFLAPRNLNEAIDNDLILLSPKSNKKLYLAWYNHTGKRYNMYGFYQNLLSPERETSNVFHIEENYSVKKDYNRKGYYINFNNFVNPRYKDVMTQDFNYLGKNNDKALYYTVFNDLGKRLSSTGQCESYIDWGFAFSRPVKDNEYTSSDLLLAKVKSRRIWFERFIDAANIKTRELSKQMYKSFGFTAANKITSSLYRDDIHWFLFKNKNKIYRAIDDAFITKENQRLGIRDYFVDINKEKYLTNKDVLNNQYFLTKEALLSTLFANKKYTIISFNKNKNNLFFQELLRLIKDNKNFKKIDGQTTATKIKHKVFFEKEDFFCDKCNKKAMIDFFNISALKSKIHSNFINSGVFVTKDRKRTMLNSLDFGIKLPKNVNILEYITFFAIQKEGKSLYLHKDDFAKKAPKNTNYYYFDSLKGINKDLKSVILNKIDWFNTFKIIYMDQEIPISKKLKSLLDYNDMDGFNKIKPTEMLEKMQALELKKIIRIFQEAEFGKDLNDPKSTSLIDKNYLLEQEKVLENYNDIEELSKIILEGDLISNNLSDWAWVWEEDEPFDDPYKIDELLLPENDTRYEDFEDLIFNKETGMPREPVNIIDDYTFIAKMPNHYPIKEDDGTNAYENVALEYLDVKTSIMRQVFLGYYHIWQDKIFEFSRMTIPQSAKKMLDYLYAWILVYFPEEDIPEALRIFRLVRWYLERAIIEDSEYKITYTPDDLTSGTLSKTEMDIPNSLSENNSMYIDTQNHIIRNKITNKEAYLNLYIENKFDTTISFSLHTISTTYIIINDKIIDEITLPFNGKLVYNIPYNEDGNTFTIKKLAADNTDMEFFIGNIVIKGMGITGDLDIEFESKIQGNKALSHVSKKILNYINLYESNEDIIRALLKGNAHISDVYDALLTYWDLHHEGKTKGKRLTIKKT